MNFLSLIEHKRDGGELSSEAIGELIVAYSGNTIPDYQMAAFLMAVNLQGMSGDETRALTLAMRDSGTVLQFPEDDRPIVDKHSTGGVGDKVSLVLAPLLACLGYRVPMISGRGLGITGGTLDKLESIPDFSTQLSVEKLVAQVQSIGVAMGGQTSEIAPADQRLYALRDVTGTVPSIPLITASILSKKLAEGLDALVMDVKYGSAAFMRERAEAKALAEGIVALSAECGVQCRALLTDMNTPLGRSVGNWLEVKEAVACLEGVGPSDLEEITIACVDNLPGGDADKARAELASGRAREKFNELLVAQGADIKAFEAKLNEEVTAPVTSELRADQDGYVHRCDASIIGELVRDLGGGRQKMDDLIQSEVGIDHILKPGEPVEKSTVLARVHAVSDSDARNALQSLAEAFEISEDLPISDGLITEVVS